MLKKNEEYQITVLGGEYGLLPKINKKTLNEKKKVLIINEAAYYIYQLLCEYCNKDKVIEVIFERYDYEIEYIEKIVNFCYEKFVNVGVFIEY